MLIAFDFDGTLSMSEMTVLLGEEKGIADRIAGITERAMNDEIGYAESLRQRVGLLEGLPEDRVGTAFERIDLRAGAATLLSDLGTRHHVAILTGGFETGVDAALERAGTGVDTVVANRLTVENGALTGEVTGPLVDGTKDGVLETLAVQEGVPIEETVAIGDGANDLPMLQVAGIAIGYDPEPAVEPHCDAVVHSMAELRRLFVEHDLL